MGLSAEVFAGEPESFAHLGDSGSFVINSHGEVAGLLYAQLTGYAGPYDRQRVYTNAGLVTSMDEVVASIEEKTGCTLRLF